MNLFNFIKHIANFTARIVKFCSIVITRRIFTGYIARRTTAGIFISRSRLSTGIMTISRSIIAARVRAGKVTRSSARTGIVSSLNRSFSSSYPRNKYIENNLSLIKNKLAVLSSIIYRLFYFMVFTSLFQNIENSFHYFIINCRIFSLPYYSLELHQEIQNSYLLTSGSNENQDYVIYKSIVENDNQKPIQYNEVIFIAMFLDSTGANSFNKVDMNSLRICSMYTLLGSINIDRLVISSQVVCTSLNVSCINIVHVYTVCNVP